MTKDNTYYSSENGCAMEGDLNKYGGISARRGSVLISKFIVWLWNPREQLLMGRSIGQWVILIVFYVSFVFCVIGLFLAMCFASIHYIIYSDTPWLEMDDSLIGRNPGIGYRPAIQLEAPLIWYKWTPEEQSYNDYTKAIWNFLYYYSLADESNYRRPDDLDKKASSKPYYYNLSQLGPCSSINYGYPEMEPCVFIKINKLYGWQPDFYGPKDKFPSSMPKSLQEQIKASPKEKPGIWVSCAGVYPYDSEHIGSIEYFPGPSFDGKYFPFVGQKNYLSPLIALKFSNITQNLVVTVECKAWAKNIHFGEDKSAGTAFISFMLGSKKVSLNRHKSPM